MNRSAARRVTALIAAPVAAAAVIAASVLSGSHGSQVDLADYGASVTAHNSMAHALGAGVPHQHNGGRM